MIGPCQAHHQHLSRDPTTSLRQRREVRKFLNHPTIAFRVLESEHSRLLAEVAEARRVAEARQLLPAGPAGVAALRWCLGSALVAIGERLQGAAPVSHPSTATAGSLVGS